jgi:caa(3)-type oxidase subunit IV
MTESHEAHGATQKTYLLTFLVLCILTGVSFWTVSEDYWPLTKTAGHNLVMVVAVCKAILVAMFFMHLKYDWFKVYFMIVGALILGTILLCALLPDITFSHSIKYAWLPYEAQ